MCGIAGAIAFLQHDHPSLYKLEDAMHSLEKRGPDAQGIYRDQFVALGHRRLSIIDTSNFGNQPMSDASGRYTIIFNGEFFNFQEHRQRLQNVGVEFHSTSDTEVLLHLYIHEGEECLKHINGFFAFCIYDKLERSLFIARDRYGIKPLVYYIDETHFAFASENKALLALGIPKKIDPVSLQLYFRLNYVPGPWGMLQGVRRLQPGHFIKFNIDTTNHFHEQEWYTIPYQPSSQLKNISYAKACEELEERMDAAIARRLISDVPLGAFLSGGIDSSVVVAIAAKHVKNLHTFSIGFSDEPTFDETQYAEIVANHCKTDHKVFRLSTNNLLEALPDVLNYLDEPFADSSALAVNILCKETRKYVTVALSGDGGDELFGGYQKHRAEWMIRNRPLTAWMATMFSPALKNLKGSRQSKLGNRLRQLHRFAEGAGLSPQERYWRWCCITSTKEVNQLLLQHSESDHYHLEERIHLLTKSVNNEHDFNQILLNDSQLVLPYDMLTKVDMMSMLNSLEVRVPFLDVNIVEWAFSLPHTFKIDEHHQKKILKDSFKHLLPTNFFERKKQGFEVPLLRWLRNDLSKMLDDYLNEEYLISQQLFNPSTVKAMRQQLNSQHPGEATARIWALLVFQVWWRKHLE